MRQQRQKPNFGRVAGLYETGRPDYSSKALRDCILYSNASSSLNAILDLGAGTGKLTRQLISLGTNPNQIVAVDSDILLLGELRKLINVPAIRGDAENIPLGSELFDLVVCGNSFHWFANMLATAEISRVLLPSGNLFLVWNYPISDDPWVGLAREIIQKYGVQNLPKYRDHIWEDSLQQGLWRKRQVRSWNTSAAFTVHKFLKYIATISAVAFADSDNSDHILRLLGQKLRDSVSPHYSKRMIWRTDTYTYQARK